MERLKKIKKTAGLYSGIYVQDYINGCIQLQPKRKRLFNDQWEKLSKVLGVPVEEIIEEKPSSIIQNNDNLIFNDSSDNYHYYCSIS